MLCEKNDQILILAPTRTAAAIISGATYHSTLGINTSNDNGSSARDHTTIPQVQSCLLNISHIFIDEISMIACHELFTISSRLSQVSNVHDSPFGGLNVILAGDFA